MIKIDEKQGVYRVIALYFLLCCTLAFLCDGTGDSGDSISHFQYAQYAFRHSDNLFFHWAKPLFTLVAAPFAQFGFVGIKIFNCLNTAISLILTYRIAQYLRLPMAWLSVLLLSTASLFVTLTFSGLTEHFSAVLLLGVILLFCQEKSLWASILVSFLPFVRSEGLLFIGITTLFLLATRQARYLPFLIVGHLVYGIVGAAWHEGNILWGVSKIPYATLNAYGKGNWGHFVEQLYYAAGLPQYILGWLGLIAFGWVILSKNTPPQYPTHFKAIMSLIVAYFLVLIIAHSAFWALGIFNSFGMPRVLNTVMPEFALLGCWGAGYFTEKIKNSTTQKLVRGAITAVVILMPFTRNPAAIFFPRDFVRTPEQHLLDSVNTQIHAQFPNPLVYFSNPCVPFYLHLDPYDASVAQQMYRLPKTAPLPDNALIVWDSWFSVIDHQILLAQLKADPRLELVQQFEINNPSYAYAIFKIKHQ